MKPILKKIIPASVQGTLKKILNNKSGSAQPKLSTSLSDNQVYPDFCIKASSDSRTFSNFRRSDIYCKILENVRFDVGMIYLEEIRKNNADLLNDIDTFRKNDKWGNPEIFEYPGVGRICPSTLRYIKVFGDLISFFGPLNNLKVCEIGVGYGGQCRIINAGSAPSEYTLVDIKPALMLSQCYLDNYILNSVLKYKTMNELEVQSYDLLISNYAFTELPRTIQDVYLNKIILNCKKGYITYNEINPDYFKSYRRDELLKIIPNSRIMEEKPLTSKKNCIIAWG